MNWKAIGKYEGLSLVAIKFVNFQIVRIYINNAS